MYAKLAFLLKDKMSMQTLFGNSASCNVVLCSNEAALVLCREKMVIFVPLILLDVTT